MGNRYFFGKSHEPQLMKRPGQ